MRWVCSFEQLGLLAVRSATRRSRRSLSIVSKVFFDAQVRLRIAIIIHVSTNVVRANTTNSLPEGLQQTDCFSIERHVALASRQQLMVIVRTPTQLRHVLSILGTAEWLLHAASGAFDTQSSTVQVRFVSCYSKPRGPHGRRTKVLLLTGFACRALCFDIPFLRNFRCIVASKFVKSDLTTTPFHKTPASSQAHEHAGRVTTVEFETCIIIWYVVHSKRSGTTVEARVSVRSNNWRVVFTGIEATHLIQGKGIARSKVSHGRVELL